MLSPMSSSRAYPNSTETRRFANQMVPKASIMAIASGAASRTLRARVGGIAIMGAASRSTCSPSERPRVSVASRQARRRRGLLSAQNGVDDQILSQFLTPDDPLELAEDLIVDAVLRSEEHTSELQSPDHLVCRLLLEKKKKRNNTMIIDF